MGPCFVVEHGQVADLRRVAGSADGPEFAAAGRGLADDQQFAVSARDGGDDAEVEAGAGGGDESNR